MLNSFSLLNNIPWHWYTTFYLAIDRWMDMWVVCTFCQLWRRLSWASRYRFCVDVCFHSYWLGLYLGLEWLSPMATLCLTFWGASRLFPKQLHHCTSRPIIPFLNLSCQCHLLWWVNSQVPSRTHFRVWPGQRWESALASPWFQKSDQECEGDTRKWRTCLSILHLQCKPPFGEKG